MAFEALAAGHEVGISPRTDPYHAGGRVQELKRAGARVLKKPHGPFRQVRLRAHYRRLLTPCPDLVLVNGSGYRYDELFGDALTDPVLRSGAPRVVCCRLVPDTLLVNEEDRATAAAFFASSRLVVCASSRDLTTLERHLATALPQGMVLHSPANLDGLEAVPWPHIGTASLATVARLDPHQKGHDLLFEVLGTPPWPSRDWVLNLYGTGKPRTYLEDLAKHYAIEGRVRFRGYVRDIRSVWSGNHLLVLPSRAEGTPISLIEAMICGRPSVVTDVGGTTEWVEDGVTGFVAAAPTAGLLADALERAWAARHVWEAMGKLAHQSACARYDPYPGRTLLSALVDAAQGRPLGAATLRAPGIAS
jgi:glycosyltransferase involved in cell wall biosynthesis